MRFSCKNFAKFSNSPKCSHNSDDPFEICTEGTWFELAEKDEQW